jgi:ABC-type bacteriocin/lantibiotic exporter with double-glycine peptidase domain
MKQKRNPPLPYESLDKAAGIPCLLDFPLISQRTEWTCGPACVAMIAQYCRKHVTESGAAQEMGTTKAHGTVPEAMLKLLSKICKVHVPWQAEMSQASLFYMLSEKKLPVVVLWDDWKGHWAIAIGCDQKHILLADPANRKTGMRLHTWKNFFAHWRTTVAGQTYNRFGIVCHP